MLRSFLLFFCFTSFGLGQASQPLFFAMATQTAVQAYIGNGTTHYNSVNSSTWGTQVATQYQGRGAGGTIYDGITVWVHCAAAAGCIFDKMTFRSGQIDAYQNHVICVGTGTTNGQGDTVTTTTPVATSCPGTGCGGTCATGDVDVSYPNTYDMHLVTVNCNPTSICVPGQTVCSVGPLSWSAFFAAGIAAGGQAAIESFTCNQGIVVLQQGDYLMAADAGTNCDTGSVTTNGTVSNGGGGTSCGEGFGEGANAGTSTWTTGDAAYGFRYFTLQAPGSQLTTCQLYDVYHNNKVSLPNNRCAYNGGGCTYTCATPIQPQGDVLQANVPHEINYIFWYDGRVLSPSTGIAMAAF